MEYTWNTSTILNSKTKNINKEIILGEHNNNICPMDPDTFDYSKLNPIIFMYIFNQNKKIIKKTIPNIYEYINNLYKIINPSEIMKLQFAHQDGINEEYLINYIRMFAAFINDEEITNIINKIINPDNHLLRIDYKKNNNQMTNYVAGRVLKDVDNELVLGSYYIKESALDIPIFTHEIGHMISGLLFGSKTNIWFYNILGETEAYYMELLASHFLKTEHNITETTDIYRLYRLFHAESDIYNLLIQNIISKHPFRNINSINKNIKKYGIQINKDEIDSILRYNSITILGHIISYLIALELVNITKQDMKIGLNIFKRLLTDQETNLETLLKKYSIDITNSNLLQEEIKIRKRFDV